MPGIMSQCFSLRRLNSAGRMAGSVMLILLLLALGACAFSPALHECVCPDAGQPWDCCAITKFAAGSVETALAQAAMVVLFFCLSVAFCWDDGVRLIAPPFRLSPSRAPPFDPSIR
jgi:hypothetical protein